MDTAQEILFGFTYILQCVSWIGRSHETASNLISVCPNNCSVMPNSSGCTRFCSRWKRLDYCLGDIIYLERHIYIDQVYLDDSFVDAIRLYLLNVTDLIVPVLNHVTSWFTNCLIFKVASRYHGPILSNLKLLNSPILVMSNAVTLIYPSNKR